MSEVKWVKLATNMPDDEKVKLIKSMPEGDSINMSFVELICMAGRINDSGRIYITPTRPHTAETLAAVLNRPITTMRLTLQTLEELEIINIDNRGIISFINWSKHQNTDGLEKIREQTRARVARYRENQKQIMLPELASTDTDVTLPVTHRNATEGEGWGGVVNREVLTEKEEEGEGEGEVVVLGKQGTPTTTPSSSDLLNTFFEAYRLTFNSLDEYTAGNNNNIPPRAKAFMRDIAAEVVTLQPDCPDATIFDAFKEAADANKLELSYVRAILRQWLKS
ncbi:phage replisome organizer N-terminal domain-containing protein [Patescibacteria group bacterium]|nr:phage replisome organizer N-terminal domain-containing protein [Patescibacteria group bacterium]